MSFNSSFDKTFENISSTIEKALSNVTNAVQETGDQISSILKSTINNSSINDSSINDSSTNNSFSNMGNAKSSRSPQAEPQSPPSSTQFPIRKIPPFKVAYGLNAAGKAVLYDIDVASIFPQLNESKITVHDLQVYLSILTSVPADSQQIIHKGAYLHGDTPLISLGIRENAKLMMNQRKNVDSKNVDFKNVDFKNVHPDEEAKLTMNQRKNVDPDEEIKKLLSGIEDEISGYSMEVAEVELKVGGNPIDPKTLKKRLLCLNEAFMKLLMKMDAVEIPADRSDVRARRKALVVRVQEEIDKTDKIIKICDDLTRAFVLVGPTPSTESANDDMDTNS